MNKKPRLNTASSWHEMSRAERDKGRKNDHNGAVKAQSFDQGGMQGRSPVHYSIGSTGTTDNLEEAGNPFKSHRNGSTDHQTNFQPVEDTEIGDTGQIAIRHISSYMISCMYNQPTNYLCSALPHATNSESFADNLTQDLKEKATSGSKPGPGIHDRNSHIHDHLSA